MALPGEDSTLFWAFDRFIDNELMPVEVLVQQVLPTVVAHGPEELPDGTRARYYLRLIDDDVSRRQPRLDAVTLESLCQMAACDAAPVEDPALVRPSPDLLLAVRCGGDGCRRGVRVPAGAAAPAAAARAAQASQPLPSPLPSLLQVKTQVALAALRPSASSVMLAHEDARAAIDDAFGGNCTRDEYMRRVWEAGGCSEQGSLQAGGQG